MTPDPSFSAETLLREATWLKQLAAQLVGDPTDADDLSQETLLIALRARPEQRSGLRPWLGRVLRNLVIRRRARPVATVDPAELACTDEASESHELVARMQVQRDVVDAVLALREPYRTTLLLRYWEGLSPGEVATRLDAPVETVRTRVKRAQAELRQRLDRHHGSRAAWAAPLLGERPPARSPVPWSWAGGGGVAMAAAVALAVLAPLIWLSTAAWPGGARPPAPSTLTATGDTATEAGAGPAASETGVIPSPGATVRTPLRASQPTTTADRPFVVTGRFVDLETGTPVAGVRVLARISATAQGAFDLLPEERATTRSGSDGHFRLAWILAPTERSFDVVGRSPDYVEVVGQPEEVDPGIVQDLGDVALRRGCRLVARAMAPRGLLERTTLHLHSWSGSPYTTLSRGTLGLAPPRFRLRGSEFVTRALSGEYRLGFEMAGPDDAELVAPATIVVPAHRDELLVDLSIEQLTESIAGVLLDDDRAPLRVPFRLSLVDDPDRTQDEQSSEEGRFTFYRRSADPRGAVRVRVEAPGFHPLVTPNPVPWGRDDLQLVLRRRTCAVTLHVVDEATGAPVERFSVSLMHRGPRRSLKAGWDHPGGSVLLRFPPPPRVAFAVHVRDPELASTVSPVFDAARLDGRVIHVKLRRKYRRSVQIVNHAGRPVPGLHAEWLEPHPLAPLTPRSRPVALRDPLSALFDAPIMWSKGVTDADGVVVLAAPAGRSYAVRVRAGRRPALWNGVAMAPDAPLLVLRQPTEWRSLRLRFRPRGVYRTFVRAKRRRRPETVGLDRPKTSWNPRDFARLELQPRPSARRDPAHFITRYELTDQPQLTLHGVPDQPLTLLFRFSRSEPSGAMVNGAVPVARLPDPTAKAGRLDIDLGELAMGEVRGRVQLDGEPLPRTRFRVVSAEPDHRRNDLLASAGPRLRPARRWIQGRSVTGPEGEFALRLPAGEYRMHVHVRGTQKAGPPYGVWSRDSVVVRPGAVAEVSLSLRRTRVRIRLLRDDGTPVSGRQVWVDDAPYWGFGSRGAKTGADGWVEYDVVSHGEMHVLAWQSRMESRRDRYAWSEQRARVLGVQPAEVDPDTPFGVYLGTIPIPYGSDTEATVTLPKERR